MLPVPTSQRTISVSFKFNIYLYYVDSGISIIQGNPPIIASNYSVLKRSLVNRDKRIHSWKNPILLALEYKNILENNGFETQTQLANELKISKVRLTHFLNLLKLDPEIISYLSFLEKPTVDRYITERFLRPLTQIKFPYQQKKKFFEMLGQA